MFFDQINTEEVFNEYARIMQKEGNLEKKASYVVPKSFLGDDNYTEVEVHAELQRMAAEGSEGGKLYNIVSEDVAKSAHPEGSTKIVDAQEGLGEVETLEAQQTKMKDVAEKKVKLAKAVMAFATDLDKAGFISLAKNLDEKIVPFLGIKVAETAAITGEYEKAEQLKAAARNALAHASVGEDPSSAMTAKNLVNIVHKPQAFITEVRKPMVFNSLPQETRAPVQALFEFSEGGGMSAPKQPAPVVPDERNLAEWPDYPESVAKDI
jgi:hypothetical protein